jgi:hypothetical protein
VLKCHNSQIVQVVEGLVQLLELEVMPLDVEVEVEIWNKNVKLIISI